VIWAPLHRFLSFGESLSSHVLQVAVGIAMLAFKTTICFDRGCCRCVLPSLGPSWSDVVLGLVHDSTWSKPQFTGAELYGKKRPDGRPRYHR
jgi:hypothetical protein